jgi:hypothetical protein
VRLRDPDGDSLALTVTGYQFPDAEDPQQRYSWHMVEGAASRAGSSWEFRYPALTCDETPRVGQWLRAVADWLDSESQAAQPPTDKEFMEPNLSFSVAGLAGPGTATVEIGLEQEFQAPEGYRPGRRTPLRLNLTAEQLRTAAAEWDDEIRPYPDLLA